MFNIVTKKKEYRLGNSYRLGNFLDSWYFGNLNSKKEYKRFLSYIKKK